MWIWTLNWGKITPRILVGSCPMAPADLERIVTGTGVSAVLSVQHDACLDYWGIDYEQMRQHGVDLGLRMLRSPMRDFDIVDQRLHLPRAVAALAGLQARGHRTYVHCTAGLGRAPLTVLSYLAWIDGRSPEEASELIHVRRPAAVPAWEAYHGCRKDLLARYRSLIEECAYALSQNRDANRGNAESDWDQAEREVLRSVLLEGNE